MWFFHIPGLSGQEHLAETSCALMQTAGRRKLGLKFLCEFCGRLCKGWWGSSGCGKELIYSEGLNNFRREKTARKNLHVAEMKALKRRRLQGD